MKQSFGCLTSRASNDTNLFNGGWRSKIMCDFLWNRFVAKLEHYLLCYRYIWAAIFFSPKTRMCIKYASNNRSAKLLYTSGVNCVNAAIMSFNPKGRLSVIHLRKPWNVWEHYNWIVWKLVRKDKDKFHKASERACEALERRERDSNRMQLCLLTRAEGLHFSAFHSDM